MSLSFKCDRCDYAKEFKDVIRVYDLPTQVAVLAWPCWCTGCRSISLAEHIPSKDEIHNEILAWRRRDTSWEYVITMGPVGWKDDEREPRLLLYYEEVLAWREERQSPGRCLFCGSVDVSRGSGPYGDVLHQDCGGTCVCYISIFGGIRRIPEHIFSVDGLKTSESVVVA